METQQNDKLTPERRETVERYKRERAKMSSAERIAFDNSGTLGSIDWFLHLLAAAESED